MPADPRADAWTALRVDLPAELEEPIASFLLDAGASGIVSETAADGTTLLEAPFAPGSAAPLERFAAYLASLALIEPAAGRVVVREVPVPAVDWVMLARQHHKPLAIGRRLLVAPPWDVPDPGGRILIVIEPGMAFGTGQHATTRGCLLAIEDFLAGTPVPSALDVGTGSGLLAIALARLGVPRVVALDLDPAVLPLARANLVQNGAGQVALIGGTVACVTRPFALVVANLLADVLTAEAAMLARVVAPHGRLVVSGIRDEQAAAVVAAYPGWRTVTEQHEDGWATLGLARSAP